MSKIIPLPKEKYKGYQLKYEYISQAVYELEAQSDWDYFDFELKRMDYGMDMQCSYTSELYEDDWDAPQAYGLWCDEGMAVIEITPEIWHGYLRVTHLLVPRFCRRMGYGTKLMNFAKEEAKRRKMRALILETQSRNNRAIAFYLAQGFALVGLNTIAYHNNDIRRGSVCLEFGFLLEDESEKKGF